MNKKILTEENCIDNTLESFPCRHDQEIMIVCESPDDNKLYCVEKIEINNYGGFSFTSLDLREILKKISTWELEIGLSCYLLGKCGECY